MRSMTGYGEAAARLKRLNITVQVRSVNHRFFNCQINLPEILSDYDNDIESLTRKYILRGSVNLSIKILANGQRPFQTFNISSLKTYYHQLKSLQKELKLKDEISINTLLELPGVKELFQPPQPNIKSDWTTIEKVITKSLSNLIKMREREGERLKIILQQIIGKMQSIKYKITKRLPAVKTRHYEMISGRVKDIFSKSKLPPVDDKLNQRIAEEVALFAQRIDISEEIQRLESHLDEFRHTLAQKAEIGKRLDFITQEMLREVNTIASKANDAEIAHYTINFKSEIEKLKEQVQNIE